MEHFRCLRPLLPAVVLVTTVTCLITQGAVFAPGNWRCRPCSLDECVNQTNCLGGSAMDECNCCSICLRVEGEPCGGLMYRLGRCDHHLYCNITGSYRRDPVGKCASKPSYKHLHNQRQYIPIGAQTTATFRYPSTKKTLEVPGTPIRVLSLSTNGPMRITPGLTDENTTKTGTKISHTTASNNKTGGFVVSGERKNKGIGKDTESVLDSPVDTKPAILFLIASGIIIAFSVVLVTFGEKFKKREKPGL